MDPLYWKTHYGSEMSDEAIDAHVAWERDLFDALTPYATGGAYANFISHDEDRQRVHDAVGVDAYDRLAAIKAEWDRRTPFTSTRTYDRRSDRPSAVSWIASPYGLRETRPPARCSVP